MVRVVGTLTTLPGRYQTLLIALKSLKAQTYKLDTIYLAVPEKASRLDLSYDDIPEEISELCVVVHPPVDYGPATKIYGGLYYEKDPETVIISFDDDVIYDHNTVEILMKHHKKHPGVAICGTGSLVGKGLLMASIHNNIDCVARYNPMAGFNVTRDGRPVDVIYGCSGVLYQRKFFPKNDKLVEKLFKYALEDEDVFRNDDILFSAYLCKKGIKRLVFKDVPNINRIENEEHNALSSSFLRVVSTMNNSINKLKDEGLFCKFEQQGTEETAVIKFIVIVLLILAIATSIYYDMVMY